VEVTMKHPRSVSRYRRGRNGLLTALALSGLALSWPGGAQADSTPVQLLDPTLQVSTVVSSGLSQPIGIVFLGSNDFLVPEKSSGQIKRVINGVVQAMPVLDLAVNSASERGLLSVVLHPAFPTSTPISAGLAGHKVRAATSAQSRCRQTLHLRQLSPLPALRQSNRLLPMWVNLYRQPSATGRRQVARPQCWRLQSPPAV